MKPDPDPCGQFLGSRVQIRNRMKHLCESATLSSRFPYFSFPFIKNRRIQSPLLMTKNKLSIPLYLSPPALIFPAGLFAYLDAECGCCSALQLVALLSNPLRTGAPPLCRRPRQTALPTSNHGSPDRPASSSLLHSKENLSVIRCLSNIT